MYRSKMSAELTSYMSQYAALTAEITANISKIGRLTSAMSDSHDLSLENDQNQQNEGEEQIKNLMGQVNKSYEEAEELFEQMELEIRELADQSERAKHTTQLQSFKVLKREQHIKLLDILERRKCFFSALPP